MVLLALCVPAIEGADEADRLAELLDLGAGSVVADVGAGDGTWSVRLARRVAPGGEVYATEIEQDMVDEILGRARDAGLANVHALLSSQTSSSLPDECCDAMLLRMVYHHFTNPAVMRRELHRALRPRGKLVIVDIEPQEDWRALAGVPERGGHGITPAELERDMTASGFTLVELIERWNGDAERYCAVFEKNVAR